MAAVKEDSEDEQYYSAESDPEEAVRKVIQASVVSTPSSTEASPQLNLERQSQRNDPTNQEDIHTGGNTSQTTASFLPSADVRTSAEVDTKTQTEEEGTRQPRANPVAETPIGDGASAADAEDLESDGEDNLSAEEVEERKSRAQALKEEGNIAFKAGETEEALEKYTSAIAVCPRCCSSLRAVVYANAAACFVRLDKHEEAVKRCTKALKYDEHYIKALLRRAASLEKLERLEEALKDYHRILEFDRTNVVALQAAMRLPDEIKQQQEKLKAEMLGKLKDLGNVFLKPFGLSTDNFKLQQDPKTGGYSVNFSK